MNEYDIQCTLEEMIRDGHTKFEFGFSRQEKDGRTMWTETFFREDAETIAADMELATYEGPDQTEVMWEVDYLC
jgi:hypothetical protein